MTTVFRTKGLEYDYVIIPNCEEGYMPLLRTTGGLVFDKAGFVKEPEPSEAIENERRLFYVAITRAMKGVLIGTSTAPTRGSQGKSAVSRPSRFLAEIQREPTVALMSPFQRLAAGEAPARSELRGQVAKYGGIKPIIDNLCDVYLPDLGLEALKRELASIVAQQPEVPFSYPEWVDRTVPGPRQRAFAQDGPRLPWWAMGEE